MTPTLVTPPASLPVSIDEAKSHLRIEADDLTTADVATLSAYIGAATNYVEEYLRRRLVTQTWKFSLDGFPEGRGEIVVPASPLVSVSGFVYVDSSTGISTAVPGSLYAVDAPSGPNPPRGRISLAFEQEWPTARDQTNSVEFDAVVGYGDPADVPEAIRVAILQIVGNLYANRETVVTGTIATKLPMSAEFLLSPYRLFEFR